MQLNKMAEEALPIGFIENPQDGTNPPPLKKKRNLPGTPDPEAEVIALSPKTLMATNRFLCEICGKGFQRDQNLQLHRRGHNLPWKLKQRTGKEPRKRVYVCPEKSCVHNHPSRALGDLTGIKKHFCRKHGEKKWKCEKCSKRYAVHSDWKAHSKTCGTREYKCDCGTIFSRRDSFITHRAFCDALAEETARVNAASALAAHINNTNPITANLNYPFIGPPQVSGMSQVHFSSIFKPISSHLPNGNIDPTNRELPLWMGQSNSPHQLHVPLSSESSSLAYGNDPVANPDHYQLNWIFGNKLVPNNVDHHELLSATKNNNINTSLPLSNFGQKNNENPQFVSIPSLFSSQHQSNQPNSTANMSATALLQKAAQIGATSSVNTSILGSAYAMKGSDQNDGRFENKFCGIYGSNLGGDMESSRNDISPLNQLRIFPTLCQTIQPNEQDCNAGGQTRDFLGVGVQPICHPTPLNGWI
ncbi:zinc finger protein NUTCRACKER [Impatiens glandulifera]|uniref:zinc finger protein NUTCRACKER n=1 Tax=Impatiens glandulifera TaxID=253017 RepID=UPI001FB06352|nr:zinc finger protein NUTCRACKER [Impatiens glandulifera]